MGTIAGSLANTAELLTVLVASGAEGAYRKVKPQARLYLKSLLVTALVGLALVPALALAKMVTGVVVFAYAAALLAIAFTLILGLLWSPLGVVMGMLAENTLNPLVGGERFVRFVATILFVELMISGYIIRVPTHQNLEAVPMLVITAAAVGLGTFVWGGWLSGRFYVGMATVMMFFITLSFFMPTVFYALTQKLQVADTEIAEAMGYRDPEIIYSQNGKVRLNLREKIDVFLTANVWSQEVYLPLGDYGFYTTGNWFEHKPRDGVNGRNIIWRVASKFRESTIYILGDGGKVFKEPIIFPVSLRIVSSGEYFRFRTDANGTACIIPIQYRE